MTTPLPREPRAGDGLVPHMSTLADRLYDRLPEVYRTMDAADATWPFKRYLGGILDYVGGIDDTIAAIAGERPTGPAMPEPWGLPADELARWRENRVNRPSALADPDQADVKWLPWLAQLVGAQLDPAASEAEHRDTIRYATSGWRGGTRGAIEDAARGALTGSRYVRVVPQAVPSANGGLAPGGVWDITIVTRTAETPDPGAVLGLVTRKGVKPAGAVLHHTAYQATWDQIEAILPTWTDWEAAGSWRAIEEVGLSYRAAPGNLLPNPSFEVDTAGWVARTNASIGRVAGGVDGAGMLRTTATAAGAAMVTSTEAAVAAAASYVVGFSIRTQAARSAQFDVEFMSGTTVLSSVPVPIGTGGANEWRRGQTLVTTPAGTTGLRFYVQAIGMAAGEYFDLDAAIVRSA